jgi:hypothetical protein
MLILLREASDKLPPTSHPLYGRERHAGALVQRESMGAQYSFHSGAGLPPELQVGRLNRTCGCDQVRDLVLDAAGTATGTDVLIRWCLRARSSQAPP